MNNFKCTLLHFLKLFTINYSLLNIKFKLLELIYVIKGLN